MAGTPNTTINWKDFWDIAAHVATVVGLAITGVWAYFNFVKSRKYYPRMELSVSGEIRVFERRQYLIPRITLKNIGQSKITLIQKGSGYRIWTAQRETPELHELKWSNGKRVHTMFEAHKWIEPGESVFDETKMFSLPDECIAVKIETRLVAQVRRFPRKNSEWNNSTILGPISKKEGEEEYEKR